ncbi:MAG: hypothetical protein VX325_03915 [Bacteroidota bacterium]|nr:hypothetical protein [Bacteroidota bacterium]
MIKTKKLIPIEINNLVRVGRDNDGGYIIPKSVFNLCDGLLSYGINKDWSFEKDFIKENPKAIVHCYDHTLNFFSVLFFSLKSIFLTIIRALLFDKIRFFKSINGIYTIIDYFFFFKKNVTHFKNRIWDSNIKNSKTVKDSLSAIISSNAKKIFVKMDIETAEYKVIKSLFKTKETIVGIAVEFHKLDKYSKEFDRIIELALRNFYIAHIHGNNYSKTFLNNNFPTTVEITFIGKNFVKHPINMSKKNYPVDGLDQPNRFSKPDHKLIF